jgi:hypothetical protein
MSNKLRRYPPELKERAVLRVLDHEGDYPSQWKTVNEIGEKLGVPSRVVTDLDSKSRYRVLTIGRDSRVMNASV